MSGNGTERTHRGDRAHVRFERGSGLGLSDGVRSAYDPTATLVAAHPHRIERAAAVAREATDVAACDAGMPPTTVAMTAKDAHATFESAGKAAKGFRSAGRS